MSHPPRPDHLSSKIEMYLDGLLTGEELRSFEEAAREDRLLRVEIEAQRRIDDSLRRMFAAPAVPLNGQLHTHAAESGPARPIPRPDEHRRFKFSAWMRGASLAAAAFVIVGVAVWAWLAYSRPHPFAVAYAREVQAGFVPDEKCTDEAKFVAWTKRALGKGVRAASLPAGVELLGWNYRRVGDMTTYNLLAKADGKDVEVFMLRNVALEEAPPERTTGPVRVFRRQLGRMCFFEVTPLERPVLLGTLEFAPEPAQVPAKTSE